MVDLRKFKIGVRFESIIAQFGNNDQLQTGNHAWQISDFLNIDQFKNDKKLHKIKFKNKISRKNDCYFPHYKIEFEDKNKNKIYELKNATDDEF